MKNFKNKLPALIAVSLLAYIVIDTNVENETAEPTIEVAQATDVFETLEATITISTPEGEYISKTVEFYEGANLLYTTGVNFDTEIQDESFVTAIEGYEQSAEDNMWWVYEVNGEMTTVGADDYILIRNDVVEWELVEF